MSQVILLTPPLAEPVGLIEAKAHLRLEHDRDDMALIGLVRSARELCERFTRRALIEQRRELRLDRPPSLFRIHRMVTLPYPPLIQVEEVAMLEPGGGESILAASNYEAIVGGEGAGRVSFHAIPENSGALAVRFRCGYGPSPEDVPAPLRQGMLMLIAHWYEQREAASQAEGSSAPFGVEALWRPYRMVSL
jgi:uncharacterized phiE125 gp8 family phage protein